MCSIQQVYNMSKKLFKDVMKWNKSFGMWSSSTHRQDIINIVWQFTDDRKTYRLKNSFQSRLIYFIYNPENDSSCLPSTKNLFSFLTSPWLLILLLTFLRTQHTQKKLIFFSLFSYYCLHSVWVKFICRRWCKRHAQFNNLHEKWHTDINPLMRSAREKHIAQWGSW
jgi:hypothetical protein